MISRKTSLLTLFVLLTIAGCPQSGPGDVDLRSPADLVTLLDLDVAPVCPPPGPFGTEVDDFMEDLSFTDTLGTAVTLHGLCGEPATLLYNYYGW